MALTTVTGSMITPSTTLSGDVTVTGTMVMGSSFMRNRIINGDMRIDQRNAGASVTASIAGTYTYTIDRFGYQASQASKFNIQQNAGSVTPPTGFTNYLGITSSSAYTLGASDYFFVGQPIEGYNIADLAWGTANAKTVTLSFWVRSSLTGTFGASLSNYDASRSYPFTYTISAANTWEQKTITIAGDTTGTWLTTTSRGINVFFGLGVGSTYSGPANAWAASNYIVPTGATSVVGTNGATWYITGVQLEIGTSATPFERRLYGQELINCQRYCIVYPASTYFTMSGWTRSTDSAYESGTFSFTPMRVAPTASATSTFGFHVPNVWIRNTTTNIFTTSIQTISFSGTVSNSGSTGVVFGTFYKNIDGVLKLEAEL